MPENLHLVTELAIILIAASVFTIISKALKQPAILGYIVAGFLVGPHLGLFPQFSTDAIQEWSELGIIFLMFGLGLDFSFKKMLKLGSSALTLAGVTCIGMFVTGMALSKGLGWSSMEGIFLGGLLGMSSTTIIIKAYDDMNLKTKPYAPLIFGALVFEDLIAIMLMVLLSALAVTGKFEGKEMLMGIVKLVFFLILWFMVGIYLIPLLLKKASKFINDEILMIVSIGLCFTMVVLANLAGFSSALGAFVMGSILSETIEGKRIESLTSKIKDLFGAIFFVSVGMMVDPAVIAQYWPVILVITIVAISGLMLFTTCGTLLAGKGVNNAIHTGFTMAQIGEFSFILAGLGCSLGVMRDFIYPVIIASSVITTITTPFLIRLGDPVAEWVEKKLPAKVLAFLNPKQEVRIDSKAEQNEWKKLLKNYILRLSLYGVVTFAICTACYLYLPKLIDTLFANSLSPTVSGILDVAISLVLVSPFIYGIIVSGTQVRQSADILLNKNSANRWPLLALICLRSIIATFFLVAIILSRFTLSWWAIMLIYILAVVLFVFVSRKAASNITHFESTFMMNLNNKEEMERKEAPVASKVKDKLAGYNIGINSITVSPEFKFAGQKLRDMPFRKHSGINIIKIIRGSHSIIIPGGEEVIYPGDVLMAVGAEEQLNKFSEIMNLYSPPSEETAEEFSVHSVKVSDKSIFAGKTLRDFDMRKSSCMVVSIITASSQLLTNPSPDTVINVGDTLWIAGEQSSVDWFTKE